MKNLKIIPAGEGWFNIKSCFGVIKIEDIHPGYGGEIIESINLKRRMLRNLLEF